MNGIDPHAWLTSTLTAIVSGHMQRLIDDLQRKRRLCPIELAYF